MAENTFASPDYDTFADSPLEISDYAEKAFVEAGSTYHVVVHDVLGKKDFSSFAEDTRKIVAAAVPMFAPVAGGARPAPFDEYWFLFHIWPNTGGGLEHLNSTQINMARDWDSQQVRPSGETDYEAKLGVTSHEFFHAWNVKRLRPKPLGPFDYSREVHTASLWISEGLTSYYGNLLLVRAGLQGPERYLEFLARLLTNFEQKPGRSERNIEETSWDTWFRAGVQGDTNLANSNYSYYDGGQIAGHLLDFAIRQATNNQKSLDDWMRLLYQRYALPKPGFEPEDAVRAANEVAGRDISEIFRRFISGKEPMPYETYFGYAGILVERMRAPELGWIGITTTRDDDGRARISNIIPGSPAEDAGLDKSDVIVAADGRLMDQGELLKTLEAIKPGQVLRLAVIRRGELKEISVTTIPYPYTIFKLRLAENLTEMQRRIFESWMGKK